jgi:hypothetical protein
MTNVEGAALVFVGLLLASCASPEDASVTKASNEPYRLAIYMVADNVPYQSLRDGTARPEGWKLRPWPAFSDFDFVNYDPTNHVFSVTLEAARRVDSSTIKEGFYDLGYDGAPFVVVAGGERIYLGACYWTVSSITFGVPMMISGIQSLTEATTNTVEFPIELGTRVWSTAAVKESVLNDKRILDAIKWIKEHRKGTNLSVR